MRWRPFLLAACLVAPSAAQEEPRGRRSAFDLTAEEDRIEVAAGTRLLVRPEPGAPTVGLVDVDTELDALERADGWVRVTWEGRSAWVPPPHLPVGAMSLTEEVLSAVTVFEEVEDPGADRLALALSHLSGAAEPRAVDGFDLYVADGEDRRLARLEAIADGLGAAYASRFGLMPPDTHVGSVVIFADRETYEGFARAAGTLVGQGVEGHAAQGVAALYLGDAPRREALDAVLVHELTHLLNRALLGPGLPVWLEEGLANDLSSSPVSAEGRLEIGRWRGGITLHRPLAQRVMLIETTGPLAARRQLLRAWADGKLPSFADLTTLSWEDFVRPGLRSLHYAYATELVRFLLDGGKRDFAAGLRAFLREVAKGAPATVEQLAASLGLEVDDLERRFGRRLRALSLGVAD